MLISVLIVCGASAAQEPGAAAPKTYAERIRSAHEHAARGELDTARAELDATDLAARGFEWKHVNLAVELARAQDAGPGLTLRGRGTPTPSSSPVKPVSKLFGYGASCRTLAVSPSGDRVAAGGVEHEIHVWNARTGDQERLLIGHSGAVVDLVFSKDGRRIASGSADGTAMLWDAAGGAPVLTFRANGEAVTAIAWSATNEWLATADTSLGVRVFDATNSEARFVARGHTKTITGLAFSPDGKFLASSSEDGSVRVIDAKRGESVRTFNGNGETTTALAFEPDSTKIRVSTIGGSLRRLDLASGARIDASIPVGEPFWNLAASADGQRFATCSELGFVRVFDAASKPVFAVQLAEYVLHALAFDAQTSRLYASGDERVIHVFETDAVLARTLQRANPSALPADEVAAGMKPLAIDALCRRVVERPGLAIETYARAQALAGAASERAPGLGQIQTTIGGAIYRQERFDEALGILTAAADAKRGWPPNLAFRAMALAKLERVDEALGLLERMETVMREKRWDDDVDLHALLAEARAVVAAARPLPK